MAVGKDRNVVEMLARPTWAEVDLGAIVENARAFRRLLAPTTKLLAAVKANAYGHGAIPVSKALEATKAADWLGVASIEEAEELRKADITLPILVLGHTPVHALERAVAHNIAVTVFQPDVLMAAAEIGRRYRNTAKVHVKVDTGMSRLGVRGVSEAFSLCQLASSLTGIEWQGVFTHFATADDQDKAFTQAQTASFDALLERIKGTIGLPPLLHAANSAAAIDLPSTHYTMVRIGIGLYGRLPSPYVKAERLGPIRQALSLKSRIVRLEALGSGSSVSYGCKYVTDGEERIATVPIGYGDGYSRMLTGKAHVLIRGQLAPVVGTICMDQLMVNVSHIDGVQAGDEVVLYGSQGEQMITLDSVAEQLGTISYEISCAIGQRVPRYYANWSTERVELRA